MKKVFQTVIDKNRGNCMQAVIATLFQKELEEVPNFIEYDGYFKPMYEFIQKNGYDYHGCKHNKNYSQLCTPKHGCFEKTKWSRYSVITPKKLYKEEGVNGLFYAGVLSPKFFSWCHQTTHAVLIDKDYNIVFDPSPMYQDIVQYPLANILGYNGVIDVLIINPKK